MSDFMQALVIGGSIAGVMIVTQYGRRALTPHGILRALLLVGGFGAYYLAGAPTGSSEVWLYAAGVVIGLACAAVATAFTRVERDTATGQVMTRCGIGFVATWVVVLGARLVFVWESEHSAAFRSHLGSFMASHEIHEAAIAPFFMTWALAMVLGRVAATLVRASRLPRPARVAQPVAV